ncbi:hypothetical protein CYLTODRAFT_414501 [Cylindrobasidium torrendii FP15055 ss-10]|uniref:Zn(2)-C6 fungal-type domain-containing protein n=1 Tax=Cylindrobasidium torrendii FP15055 ss-10 TaxID=1314674 RepID=A0A0D7AXS2_9AGAR|nr:hypothetical protein CYLTODRAFT_414501 [Cylindrobasidium torrendii FP15055 ss-10]
MVDAYGMFPGGLPSQEMTSSFADCERCVKYQLECNRLRPCARCVKKNKPCKYTAPEVQPDAAEHHPPQELSVAEPATAALIAGLSRSNNLNLLVAGAKIGVVPHGFLQQHFEAFLETFPDWQEYKSSAAAHTPGGIGDAARAVNDTLQAKALIVKEHSPALHQALIASIGGWLRDVPSHCPDDMDVFDFMLQVEAIEAENAQIAARQTSWLAKRGQMLDQKVAQLQGGATPASHSTQAIPTAEETVVRKRTDIQAVSDGAQIAPHASSPPPPIATLLSAVPAPTATAAALSPVAPSNQQPTRPSEWPGETSLGWWLEAYRRYLTVAVLTKGVAAGLVPGAYTTRKIEEVLETYPSWGTSKVAEEAARAGAAMDS